MKSVVNEAMEGSKQPTPEVGMGATMLFFTDRKAGTVIKVTPSGKTIYVQRDRAKRVDRNGLSEVQEYEHERDPKGSVSAFRLTKRGTWTLLGVGGVGLLLGHREEYEDPHF